MCLHGRVSSWLGMLPILVGVLKYLPELRWFQPNVCLAATKSNPTALVRGMMLWSIHQPCTRGSFGGASFAANRRAVPVRDEARLVNLSSKMKMLDL
jgi:hypothetical protein